MKRRTRLKLVGCAALCGTFSFVPAAAATEWVGIGGLPVVDPTSGSPPVVPAPTVKVTVLPGDTLTAIGARTSRTWEQLAGYNQLPDPNLITPDQVLTIPPVTYDPPALSLPAPQIERAVSASTGHTTGATGTGGVWSCIAQHESGSDPSTNTGNGYYGMYQFDQSSWQAAGGGPGLPSDYSAAEQTAVAERWQSMTGWGAWPNTSAMCGE